MQSKDVIKNSMELGTMVLKSYVDDLSDADLMRRPGAGCNHLAWQLGHLIASECGLLNSVKPGAAPELPAGFAEQHSKETITVDDASKFRTKQEYLDLLDRVNTATLAALSEMSDSDLDQPSGEKMRARFPTVGSVMVLIASHPMMHAGQFVPVRRALGKPIVI